MAIACVLIVGIGASLAASADAQTAKPLAPDVSSQPPLKDACAAFVPQHFTGMTEADYQAFAAAEVWARRGYGQQASAIYEAVQGRQLRAAQLNLLDRQAVCGNR